MPPPPGAGSKKKKKGRAPKHQNSFAFRHNPGSKKTEKILTSPNVGLCRRCYDKIEWRKKYRKYKPRTQPGKCNLCFQKNILAAYHTICTKCVASDRAVAAMVKRQGGGDDAGGDSGVASTAAAASTSSSSECQPVVGIPENNDESAPNGEGGDEGKGLGESEPVAKNEATNPVTQSRRRIRVCAVCAAEPSMSKYSNASAEDDDIIEKIRDLEDSLESGADKDDGHKLTLREAKGVERKIEKLQSELKERRKKRNADDEEREEGGDDADNAHGDRSGEDDSGDDQDSTEGEQADAYDVVDDPFLLATRGKALVGEEYQKMLLAREH